MKDKRITLDAGHGGSDPGAVGAKGTKEKDITLKITQKVEELLKKKGAKVTMTRVKDVDVYGVNATDAQELQARVDVAENSAADLFISLHINASVNKT
ncbi:MAG: N-acetylmuramoyl-L-alanine amidase family protein [Phascolarctobacterium faecium]